MSHCVTAIIAGSPVIERITGDRGWIAVDLRDGLRLLPLDDDDLDSLDIDFTQTIDGFTYLSPNLAQFCAGHSVFGPLVYLETEYFGGMGNQAAVAFAVGAPVPPTPLVGNGAINAALRSIGIVASSGVDEFDFVGLSRYRHTSDWKEAANL